MKIITCEQFHQADENTKKAIMEWWEPEEFDHYVSELGEYCSIPPRRTFKDSEYKKECTPLLSVGQLVDFIGWKSGERISISGGPVWVVEGEIHIGFQAKRYEDELLQGLWECAKQYCNREY